MDAKIKHQQQQICSIDNKKMFRNEMAWIGGFDRVKKERRQTIPSRTVLVHSTYIEVFIGTTINMSIIWQIKRIARSRREKNWTYEKLKLPDRELSNNEGQNSCLARNVSALIPQRCPTKGGLVVHCNQLWFSWKR